MVEEFLFGVVVFFLGTVVELAVVVDRVDVVWCTGVRFPDWTWSAGAALWWCESDSGLVPGSVDRWVAWWLAQW